MRSINAVGAVLATLCCVTSAIAADSNYVAEAKKAVVRAFKDPESARFRDVFVGKSKAIEGRLLCGEVNAKNSYGAYVGYRRFFIVDTIATTTDIEDPSDSTKVAMFQMKWDIYCLNKHVEFKKANAPVVSSSPSSTYHLAISGDNKKVPIALSQSALSELASAGGDRAIEMAIRGSVFFVDTDTEVSIIDSGVGWVKVRVTSGKMSGREGWAQREFLKP